MVDILRASCDILQHKNLSNLELKKLFSSICETKHLLNSGVLQNQLARILSYDYFDKDGFLSQQTNEMSIEKLEKKYRYDVLPY
ncbi:CLUMA_CG016880, isoform A [Clunio marinus]|uniref:CLUMA_CG016880, isoform A n=1 Tax=Clunio marinus TaxID=568069 RepID=A0A1J1IUE3_9DIPT|nr:CLUMA_CG016880, isoform A [Clunio marinus]